MTNLNLASNSLVDEGAKIVAAFLPKCTYVAPSQRVLYPISPPDIPKTDIPYILSDNRAISQFTFSGDRSDSKPVTMETSMTEADFSGKGLGLSGAILLSVFLPKCT
jgi:hypothetical protein